MLSQLPTGEWVDARRVVAIRVSDTGKPCLVLDQGSNLVVGLQAGETAAQGVDRVAVFVNGLSGRRGGAPG